MNKCDIFRFLSRKKGISNVLWLYEILTGNSQYKYNYGYLGCNSFVDRNARILNPRFIKIGNEVTLQKDVWLNSIRVDKDKFGMIVINNGVNIGMRTTVSSSNEIVVKDNVLIGMNVYIADHDHIYEDIRLPIINQGIKTGGRVEICKDSWIGTNVVIIGVDKIRIGEHSIIGANSVVKTSIPDYSIFAGSPAKIIGKFDFKTKVWRRIKK